MSTKDGRAFIWQHLSTCGVFTTSYTNNALDMSYNEGQRNVGLRLLSDLQDYAFTYFQVMEVEAREPKEEDNDDIIE